MPSLGSLTRRVISVNSWAFILNILIEKDLWWERFMCCMPREEYMASCFPSLFFIMLVDLQLFETILGDVIFLTYGVSCYLRKSRAATLAAHQRSNRRIGYSSTVVPARGQFIYMNDTAIVDDSERHIERLFLDECRHVGSAPPEISDAPCL